MKESTLIEMQRRIEVLGQAIQRLTVELGHLKELGFGNMQLIKQFDGYEEALEKLKDSLKKDEEEKTED